MALVILNVRPHLALDQRDRSGKTLLHCAVENRRKQVFARNDIYQSLVVQCALVEDGLVVLTRAAEVDAIKDWAVAMITVRGELFVHRSEHQYFTLQGALKKYCELNGESLTDTIDDYT